jgi:hypothetical protein
MNPLPLNQLIFKGTHNSYQCHFDTPCMNHPPHIQIDDFGVWSLELDFSIVLERDFQFRAVVGHEGPGDGACWGYYLVDFLRMIAPKRLASDAVGSLALRYRPVFINFDIKDWGLTDRAWTIGLQDLVTAFGPGNVLVLADYLRQSGRRYPSVSEMAGKAVLYSPSTDLRGTYAGDCTTREAVEDSIRIGDPLGDAAANCGPSGCRVFRLDQYQADWTFEYGVPPNPLVVDWAANPPWTVLDSEGDDWECDGGDVWRGQVVHEQGTCRFPYKTVARSITRAEGTTPNGVQDTRRAGYGWTVLIRPGHYVETLKISIPLTLRKDDRFAGTVIIGR